MKNNKKIWIASIITIFLVGVLIFMGTIYKSQMLAKQKARPVARAGFVAGWVAPPQLTYILKRTPARNTRPWQSKLPQLESSA